VAVPVALGVLAAGFTYEALQGRAAMTEIVVTRSELAAGTPIDAGDTRLVRVHSVDRSLLRGLVTPPQLGEGWVATVAIPAGEPVTSSEISMPAKGPVLGEMSIAVPVDQAVGGRLAPGDRVDVIAGNAAGGAHYVAQGLRIVAVSPSSGNGALLGASTNYYVVVAVGKQTALRIAAALAEGGAGAGGAGGIELVRSSGEKQTAHIAYEPTLRSALKKGPSR
jgi:Flp pilus assembly protein CpaB